MKKNLALFLFLIGLLVVAYIFQEKRIEKEHLLTQQNDQLVNFEVTHLKLPNVEATKINGQWREGEHLLSHNTFKLIEKKLSEIMKLKEIQGEWKTYFLNPVYFEINHEKWAIGDLSLDRQGFYISRGDKIYLAMIEGASHELTQDEGQIASIKLNELLSALSKKKEILIENQLFRYFPSLPMEKIVMNVEGYLPFELDFNNNTTVPAPLEGIRPHKDLRTKFNSLLTQVMIKEVLPYSEKLKFKKMGELQFHDGKKLLTWELWLKSNNRADAVIIEPTSKKAFLMVGGTLKLFFVQIQDYWDKKVIPSEHFISFTRLSAPFVQGQKKAMVTILNREPMAFEVKGYKVEQLKMEQLIQLIFNLGPKEQGDRVSLLTTSEKKQLLSSENLRIEVMDQELILWRKQQELIVANLTQGFKIHFTLLDESFRGTFEDVLK